MELRPGDKLGPYEIVSFVARGGIGDVWKGRDTRLNRDVAIKTSRAGFSGRFKIEAQAVAALNHPNVCTLYDVGSDYLVMELVEGPTLADRIRQGPIPLEEALGIAKQIANGLEAAHEKGITHRDLKPANVKIRPDGSVKVLDFGLAKSAPDVAPLTPDSPTILSLPGMILGTAGYMSPEQARGEEADKRSDIWAFGVVLFEMLTAQRLFQGKTVSDILAAVLREEPDLTKVPRRAERLLRACLEKDERRRLRDTQSGPATGMNCSSVPTTTGSWWPPTPERADSFVPDKPRLWSEKQLVDLGSTGGYSFDPAPDGKRVAALMPAETPEAQQKQNHVIFLMNFADELQRKVPAGK